VTLSRGARRLFDLLQSYARHSGRAFPFQKTLAGRMECADRTIRRYINELVAGGMLAVRKRQHSSAEYVIQTGQNVRSGVRSGVRSERPFISVSEKKRSYVPFKPTGKTEKPFEYGPDPELEAFIAAHEARQGATACVSAPQVPDRKPAMRQEASNHQRAQVQS
jgi:hypothetical protein